ncbi:HPF/RaiA family ribosome-associated protein [Alishewanella sp. 16-MA]|uniref:HPF/RaiA family ribosome-associated protein n=1 Tax=Alishewanella maricola TaxID=2795740 RepID=A0ABS8C1U2_9ALTE|nr:MULTISPECIES: HPF/RaiA family ribosome-associated protein [Gammaproteobacteria]MDP4944157.1 HPF/RaiA family ribosome-associated protein [Alishewanella sp.]MDP5207082.1 HPF/RaiA family ribosome-associated protein [Alishewanella sp. SMS9]MCB5226307.1 HPF/RaiA family ribosome-associated protein [Alishewanella maricola]MCC5450674.1 HPF/RaiA family ribosome-associated protein [Rheinheimera sp. UJ51]MCF4008660.1 HPF/RaiA family ribosome-associated protein [Rheinheimera sp. UJ63]
MQVQINSDRHIQADERLAEFTRDTLNSKLSRFADHITRVEVHLSDENSSIKRDGHDKRCLLEARLEGVEPVAVTEHAATVGQAVTGAADKLQRKLASIVGKLRDKHNRKASPDFSELEEVIEE